MQLADQQSSPPSTSPLPAGLRIAHPGDEDALFFIFHVAYLENGFGRFNRDEVKRVIADACQGKTYAIGLIEGPDRIEAVLGLMPCKMWYGTEDDWYSRHAETLFAFADWWERHNGRPLVISVFPTERLAAKERLFARHARPAGSIYLVGHGVWRTPTQQAAA